MRKNAMIYLEVLPRNLRPLSAMNSISQLSDFMLTKLAEKGREDVKAKKLPRKNGFGKRSF